MGISTERRNQMVRLAQFCYSEQLIDRQQLIELLAALEPRPEVSQPEAVFDDESAIDPVAAAFPVSLVRKAENRFAEYYSDLKTLKETLDIEDYSDLAFGSNGASAGGSSQYSPHDVLVVEGDAHHDHHDLQVSHLPRFIAPLAGIAVIALFVWVGMSFKDAADKFQSDDRPYTQRTSEDKDSAAGAIDIELEAGVTDDIELAEAEAVPVETTLETATIYAERGNWDNALNAIDDYLTAGDIGPELGILRAGILLGKSKAQDDANTPNKELLGEALKDLLHQEVVDASNRQWSNLFAACLIRAAEDDRKEAIAALEVMLGKRKDAQLQLALDWASARDQSTETPMPELDRRKADFTATGVDHLFLVFSSLPKTQDGPVDEGLFAYHLERAKEDIREKAAAAEGSPETTWLEDVYLAELVSAVEKLEDRYPNQAG